MTDTVKNLMEQLKEAKAEGKVENKKSKFLKKKTTGEKINKLLKEAAYGKEESKVDDFGLRKNSLKVEEFNSVAVEFVKEVLTKSNRSKFIMAKLCPRGKAAAKRKFKVYPSAYANMYASAVCSGKVTPRW